MAYGRIPTPAVLGHEAAGIVEEVGDGVSQLKPGDHVISCPSVFCGYCEECMSGHPSRCSTRPPPAQACDKPRMSKDGKPVNQFADLSTYAEKMLVHENALVKIADDMPLDRAALIGCGVTTGVGAVLNTAKIEPGSTVAVFGCGGVGLSAIQGARIAGARQIIAVDISRASSRWPSGSARPTPSTRRSSDPVEEIRKLTGGGRRLLLRGDRREEAAEQASNALKAGRHRDRHRHDPGRPEGRNRRRRVSHRAQTARLDMGSNRFRIDMPQLHRFLPAGPLNLDDMISQRGKLEDVNEAFRAMKAGEVARTVIDVQIGHAGGRRTWNLGATSK